MDSEAMEEQKQEELMFIEAMKHQDETYVEFVARWFAEHGSGAFVVVPETK